MDLDPTTTKYLIKAQMSADGVVEKPDVIGAIFGQTEGLLGDELDLRDLQKSGRIGRIEVDAESKKGKTNGTVTLPSSLDKVETAILAAALETIDRVGPCKATIKILGIDDVRESKRKQVQDRAKQLLQQIAGEGKDESGIIVDSVKETVRVEEIVSYGQERLPAGPNISSSDAILVVEGRNDVANLLKHGIKNAIATEGTSIPKTITNLSREKVVTAFVDGDRGGELLLKELLQLAEIDFVARAPRSREVEELTQKQLMKSLRNKLPAEQYVDEFGIEGATTSGGDQKQRSRPKPRREPKKKRERDERPPPRRERQRGPPKGRRDDEPERDEPRRSEPTGPLAEYRDQLNELSGKLQAVLLDDKGKVTKGPLAVRELAETLKSGGGGVKAVVFDGVITQRLLDIALDKKIATLVGVKKGNITKEPQEVEILTRDDL